MTIEQLKGTVPRHAKKMITQGTVDILNDLEGEHGQDFAEHYKQNFISMSSILRSGSYNGKDYTNAVKFISFQLMEHTDIDAYMMAFPDRYQRLMDRWSEEDMTEAEIRTRKISPFVTAYKKNELVAKLTEQSLIPPRILNAPMFQDALNIQMGLAVNAGSEMVRMQAANSILTHLAQPESTKIELEVAVKGQDEILALRNTMADMAVVQRDSIARDQNTPLQIAEQELAFEIIEAEVD